MGLKSMFENDGTNFTATFFYFIFFNCEPVFSELRSKMIFLIICLKLSFQFDLKIQAAFAVVRFMI